MTTQPKQERLASPDRHEVTGVRVYTRSAITLPWLATTVAPVVHDLRADGSAALHLRRGWLHGPHVDIVARGAAGNTPDWAAIAGRLDAGPLTPGDALDEPTYLAQARESGRMEAVPAPYLPLAEHGQVDFLTGDDVDPVGGALHGLREQATVNTALCTPLVATIEELAHEPADGPVRLVEAFAALADSYFLGLDHGVFSFRSHAEAFFAWAAPTRDLRPVFAARLAAESSRLRPVVEQRLSGDTSALAAAWRTAFAYAGGALDGAVVHGALTVDMLDAVNATVDTTTMGPPTAPRTVPRGSSPDTDFHRTVLASGAIDDPPPFFAAYRVLLNLFYQQLPLLTVSPMQRYYTCFAVAELVDEVLGESWRDRLERAQVRRVGGAPAPASGPASPAPSAPASASVRHLEGALR